jgi:hypothetical protein
MWVYTSISDQLSGNISGNILQGSLTTICQLQPAPPLSAAVDDRGARFQALDDPWCDTTTPQGELILTVMGGLAEFERKLIRQRCEEGIKRAKAKGTQFGRKSVLDAGHRKRIAERYAAGETMADLAREYECGEATIWRALHSVGGPFGGVVAAGPSPALALIASTKQNQMSPRMSPSARLRPVIDAANVCVGHVVRTARGWIVYDRHDRQIGVFPSEHEAAAALTTPTPA